MTTPSIDAWVRSRIRGRIALRTDETGLLYEMCRIPGDHLDIGTLWGGSAILAALAKPPAAQVWTLDDMSVNAWLPKGDEFAAFDRATAQIVAQNFCDCGVSDRVYMVLGRSYPWPFPSSMQFSTAFLDGDHEYPSVAHDWESAVRAGCVRIGIHDYGVYGDPPRPGPMTFVEEQVRPDPEWSEWGRAESLIVFERKGGKTP